MATLSIEVDLPPDLTITAYQRHGQGHGFEVSWPLPSRCCCDRCHAEAEAHLEFKNTVQVVRDLELWGQPSFWIYRPVFHRCPVCHHRQHVIPPFKRQDVSYTYRFERHVLRLLIGSDEEEVGRRLGISAEMVHLIVRNQLADAKGKAIDPQRRFTDLGIDELSLKKRHRLYATILTDLTDPEQPEVLAVAAGRDAKAAQQCLENLTPEQRQQVRTYRADMAAAFHKACRKALPNAKAVADRFHVAKKFHEAIDRLRKKLTQAYQAKLSKSERKQFSSLMWEFRRDPKTLTPQEKQKLEAFFQKEPRLRTLYGLRVRFQEIFDTARDRHQASRWLIGLWVDMVEEFPELQGFVRTFEQWEEEILNYFDARQTSGPVEGINNKARVILRRAYGLKSPDSLWTRLILDLNRAREVGLYTIKQIRELAAGFRMLFAPART